MTPKLALVAGYCSRSCAEMASISARADSNRGPGRQPAEDDRAHRRSRAPFVELIRPEEERLPELDVGRRQLELRRHHADDLDVHVAESGPIVR